MRRACLIAAGNQGLPLEDKGAEEGAKEDAEQQVAVVVHGEQHEDIADEKGEHVQESPDGLLQNIWSERGNGTAAAAGDCRGGRLVGAVEGGAAACGCGGDGDGDGDGLTLGDVLPDEVSVVFLDGAAEELEGQGEEEDADAGAGEHGGRGDAPLGGEEAGVDGVEVEQHGYFATGAAAHAAHAFGRGGWHGCEGGRA